jgi:hypothetical protein
MRIKCIYNTGEDLRPYENKSLRKEELGRFGATGYTKYGELDIGKEYLVMGMIMFESYLAYLIDDNHIISICPCQLFEVLDTRIPPSWHFRLIERDEDLYPYIQAIWGYRELCFDKKTYENLIIEQTEETIELYFKRKKELEKELNIE